MKKVIIRVLIAHSDPNVLRYLSDKAPTIFASLGLYAHIITTTTFKETRKTIEREDIDISCFYFDWEDEAGHGEDLIELIKKIAPHQTMITVMDHEDHKYQAILFQKYYPILCLTKKTLFSNIKGFFSKAALNLRPCFQIIDIDTNIKTVRFYLEEVAYVHGHAGKTTLHLYDFVRNLSKEIEIPLSITHFLTKHNQSNTLLRCHRDYAVNKMMIRHVHKSREAQCIELIYTEPNGYPMEISMSESYKKAVLHELRKNM
ncbi:MAG: LytTR family transcriptional regulator DNA-binding domain-containing protein [Defluviitaleaceae bacterium]|nr:LytTR family transcriptional regulator DNA-binding domain-containing protein [Defluviitaleaceae bacterium]